MSVKKLLAAFCSAAVIAGSVFPAVPMIQMDLVASAAETSDNMLAALSYRRYDDAIVIT